MSVKQANPQDILASTVTFSVAGGTASTTRLFDPALLGLASLSDVATLAPIDALVGTPVADNLLVLSSSSERSLIPRAAGLF